MTTAAVSAAPGLIATAGRGTSELATQEDYAGRIHVDLDAAGLEDLRQHADQTFPAVAIAVPTWAHLRRVLTPSRLLGSSREIVVHIVREGVGTMPPSASAAPRTRILDFECRTHGKGTLVTVRLSRAVPVHHVLRGVAGIPRSVRPAGLRIGLADRVGEAYVVGQPDVRYVGIDDEVTTGGVDVPLTEVVVAQATATAPPGSVARVEGDQRPRLYVALPGSGDDGDLLALLPPVDTAVVNPMGFDNSELPTVATLRAGKGHVAVVDDSGSRVVQIGDGNALSTSQVERLRSLRGVVIPNVDPRDATRVIGVVAQLAAAGVPLVYDEAAIPLPALDGSEFGAELRTITRDDLDDPLRREAASVRIRRSALRERGPAQHWRVLAQRLGQPPVAEPSVSVVLMTKRPARLAGALEQLRGQVYPGLQLVLGLHGEGFDDAEVERLLEPLTVHRSVVRVDGGVPFGTALNQATQRCDGRFVTKWDDDDLYGSEHVWDLILAAEYSGADVVGKVAEFTMLTQLQTTVRRNSKNSERFTRHVAGGTLLLRKETWASAGGWRPVPRFVDDALLRQVIAGGGTVYRTHGFGYVLARHDEGHTWEPGNDYFLQGDDRRWPVDSPLQTLALEQRMA